MSLRPEQAFGSLISNKSTKKTAIALEDYDNVNPANMEKIRLMKERIEFSLGDVIRNIRQRKGLTAKQLAEKANLSTTTIQAIENGGDYRSRNLRTLAKALGYSVVELWHQVPPAFEVTIEKPSSSELESV